MFVEANGACESYPTSGHSAEPRRSASGEMIMSTSTQEPAHLALLDAHTEVERQLDQLSCWKMQLCELGQPRFGEMGMRLREIRQLLTAHFAAEEEGGYLAPALSAAPQFTRRAEGLQHQHREFLRDLDEMVVRLTASPAQFPAWSDACREFDELLARLRVHEHAENEIVQSAFELDTGDAN